MAEGLEALAVWLRRLAPNTVSTSTMTTLGTLDAYGPLRVSELAAREAISQPGMTALINRLEANGWAERYADPTDGRAALVRITAKGRRMVAERRARDATPCSRNSNDSMPTPAPRSPPPCPPSTRLSRRPSSATRKPNCEQHILRPGESAGSPFKQPKAVWAVAFACVISFMGIGLVDPILKTLRWAI